MHAGPADRSSSFPTLIRPVTVQRFVSHSSAGTLQYASSFYCAATAVKQLVFTGFGSPSYCWAMKSESSLDSFLLFCKSSAMTLEHFYQARLSVLP